MNSLEIIENLYLDSSYKDNNIGLLLYSLVRSYKPINCMEFGVLSGYSTISIACALRDNKQGNLKAVDLFENYEYKHSSFASTYKNLTRYELHDQVSLIQDNFNSHFSEIKDNSLDFVHFDISNDGNKLKDFITKYYNKLKQGSIVIFEGGSQERDNIGWMRKYNKKPISSIFEDSLFKERFNFFILKPFPSITICEKITNGK